MLNGDLRGLAGIVGLGFVAGLGGCLVLGGGETDPAAVCVVDYDECLGLGVDESICQAIYDACDGSGEGATSGPGGDDGGGCWEQVQHCLENNGGDEQLCQALIDACQGQDDGMPGDDGNGCWDEVEQCYQSNPDMGDCEALAMQCLGDDGGPLDDGMDDNGNQCEEILMACAEPGGEISDACWAEYEQCLGEPPPPPICADPADPACCQNGEQCCDPAYAECVDSGQDPQECEALYEQCIGGMPGDGGDGGNPNTVCEEVVGYCQQTVDPGEVDCDTISQSCEAGASEQCIVEFFDCVGVEYPDTMSLWETEQMLAQACLSQLSNCNG